MESIDIFGALGFELITLLLGTASFIIFLILGLALALLFFVIDFLKLWRENE